MRLSRSQSRSLAKWIRRHHPRSVARVADAPDVTAIEAELGFAVRGDECIEWGMSTQGGGYGKMGLLTVDGWWFPGVHRLVRECVDGEVNSLDTLHTCSNKACFNPDHTYSGDDRRNALDRSVQGETTAIGDTHPCAKLTRVVVEEMRSRHAEGESMSSLGREFGVTKSVAIKAIKGITWAH